MPPHEQDLQQSYTREFAAALMNPARPVPGAVRGPKGKAAAKRYNVYRNNVTVSLIDALAAIYPAVQRITGIDFFRAMARFHIRATPPTSPLLFEYGRQFPDFIENYEYAQSMSWLADTARLERAWLDAYHAADLAPMAAASLATIPVERLADAVFTPHPATRVIRSNFAIVTIFTANRQDRPDVRIDAGAAEDALVTRPDLEVAVRHLAEGGAVFLTNLMIGRSLGEAAALAAESSASFDLAANIAGMIQAGAFTRVTVGDADDC
jgi:hypothetical protein